jgi:hypothetical protein
MSGMDMSIEMMPPGFPLDLDKFHKLLLLASKNALQSIKSSLSGETLYSFALVTTGLFEYVFANANTEECLRTAARKYLEDTGDFGGDIQLALKYCQWEPTPYWRFFQSSNDAFDDVNAFLNNASIADELCQLDDHEFNEATRGLEQILFNVLRKMDKDGDFGTGTDRENFVVAISYQDQTYEDLHRCVDAMNPTIVSNMVWNDLSDVLRYWQNKAG